ncbi:uncharacterized protein F4812DRAFT_461771 [Daldinia caldariorum]|uniref:uncharacterized protein n=1 Tax=Daldinia caldariorum TaxID=326644 RepID=UPI00200865C4|nr:uncharacterized protein F4812DRAFT_461771 [Daldinia caldariorum]KAI1465460.1 hypothetical protein F4812DRAFT_461771 [Daldinia caldariorum]
MSNIRNVVVFGAIGSFSTSIATALVQAGFHVLIHARLDSTTTFPSGIPHIRTQYTFDRLMPLLRGADAVVTILGLVDVSTHNMIIDAAVVAGAKRFILGDFS